MFDEPAGVQLAEALASSSLEDLQLGGVNFWNNQAAAAAIMRALTGHPTLQELDLNHNTPTDEAAAGVALGTLVAANSPALTRLYVNSAFLGDVGLGPIFDALPCNTHLHTLDCCNTDMSEDFARERFLPAVRANTSLRTLEASAWWDDDEDDDAPPEVLEAEALVAARSAADRAA